MIPKPVLRALILGLLGTMVQAENLQKVSGSSSDTVVVSEAPPATREAASEGFWSPFRRLDHAMSGGALAGVGVAFGSMGLGFVIQALAPFSALSGPQGIGKLGQALVAFGIHGYVPIVLGAAAIGGLSWYLSRDQKPSDKSVAEESIQASGTAIEGTAGSDPASSEWVHGNDILATE